MAGTLVAVLSPVAATASDPDGVSEPNRFWVDAVCYHGHGQVMDRSKGYRTLADWVADWVETNRNVEPGDRMDGVCSEPLDVFTINLVEADGLLIVLYEAPRFEGPTG